MRRWSSRERLHGRQLEPGVFDSLQIARLRGQGPLQQRVAADEGVVELGGSVAAAFAGLAGVVEVEVQLLAQVRQCPRRVVLVVQQGLAVQQLAQPVHDVPVALAEPAVDDLLESRALPGVLRLERVVVEVIVRPRDEFLQRGRAVVGQAEGLEVTDFLG